MRKQLADFVEKGRIGGPPNGGPIGAFRLRHPETQRSLQVIAGDGLDWESQGLSLPAWEHVSVKPEYGVPLYAEMKWIKEQFWEPTELVLEFHVPASDHINRHPQVLHLWRPIGVDIPLPPKECV